MASNSGRLKDRKIQSAPYRRINAGGEEFALISLPTLGSGVDLRPTRLRQMGRTSSPDAVRAFLKVPSVDGSGAGRDNAWRVKSRTSINPFRTCDPLTA